MGIIALSSCSSLRKGPKNEISKAAYYTNSSFFIDAKRAVFQGNFQEAERLYNKVLNNDPENHAAAYELSRLLTEKDIISAINYGEKAQALRSENKWYLLNLIRLYSIDNNYKKASVVAKKLVNLYPDNIRNYYRLVNIYLKNSDYNNALKTYNEIENRFGFNADIALRKKDIYFNQKEYQKAAKEMEILIEKYPTEKRYYGIAADIFMAAGKEGKAMEFYKKVLEIDPKDGQVHMVLSSYYYSIGNKEKSFEEMKKGFESPQLNVDSKISVMMNLYKLTTDNPDNKSLQNQSDTLLNILYKVHPDNPKVLAMKGDFLVRNRQWEEALKAYKKVIEIDSSKYLVWEQLILITKEMGDYKAMQNYSSRALLLFSQYPIVYYFHAQSNYLLGQYRQADASLNLGLSFVYKPQQKVEFYTLMGIVRDSMQQYKEAEISFEKALIEKPNFAPALKAYALHLVLVNEDLDKAQTYARKCLELNYNSTEYIYAYSRVIFAKKEYPEAMLWVDKGLKIDSEDVALNHLKGEILWQTGEQDKAQVYLNKGKKD